MRAAAFLIALLAADAGGEGGEPGWSAALDRAEQRRVATIQRLLPATIAVFNQQGDNGGSGVLISPDGYALTNYHVVAPCGPFLLCGLPDGSLVDAVLVGLDPTGDLALVRMLDTSREYPHAQIGDSDTAAIGDEVFVAGNPFLLAEDFQPTVTHGVISGTGRYQYPSGGVLEYADCLQTDAAINPGNSGGPLYDRAGKLIGINGRASFEKRGRVNVGVGYAVSINQAMRFVGQMKTGRVVDRGALGATVRTTNDGRVVIDAVSRASDAHRRGLRFGDRVLAVDGRPISSANELMNAIATRPAAWRTRVTYQNPRGVQHAWVRLEPRHSSGELEAVVEQGLAKPKRSPSVEAMLGAYRHRPGYANFAAAKRATERPLKSCPHRHGAAPREPWRLTGRDEAGVPVELRLSDNRSEATLATGRSWVDAARPMEQQSGPPGSGGLMVALHAWREFVVAQGVELNRFHLHGPTPWGDKPVLVNRVVASFDAARVEYYLDPGDGKLLAIEAWLDDTSDPCRMEFSRFGEGPAALGGVSPGSVLVSRGGRALYRWRLDRLLPEPDQPAAEGL